jgi:hypothetical protein
MEEPCLGCPDPEMARCIIGHATLIGVELDEITCDRTDADSGPMPGPCFIRYEGMDEPLDIPTTPKGNETTDEGPRITLAEEMGAADISDQDIYPN